MVPSVSLAVWVRMRPAGSYVNVVTAPGWVMVNKKCSVFSFPCSDRKETGKVSFITTFNCVVLTPTPNAHSLLCLWEMAFTERVPKAGQVERLDAGKAAVVRKRRMAARMKSSNFCLDRVFIGTSSLDPPFPRSSIQHLPSKICHPAEGGGS